MRRVIIGWVGAAALVSGAGAPAMAAVAPALTAMFQSHPADALGSIAQGCSEDGQAVTQRSAEAVTCEVPLGRPERIAARILLRTAFRTAPHAFIRFKAMGTSVGGSVVQVTGWVEDGPSGDVRRTASLAGLRFNDRMERFLARLGGRVSPA